MRNTATGFQSHGTGESERTLAAIREFKRCLENADKDLSRMSKRLRNREVTQSAGFATIGIHEAVHYLAIVKKVLEKTQRVLQKRTLDTTQPNSSSS